MLQHEMDLIRQIRNVGVKRAREIFGFLSFFSEGAEPEEQAPVSRISKKREAQLTLGGELILASFPKRKVRGVDPFSARQVVMAAGTKLLQEAGPLHRSEVIEHVTEITGLPRYKVAGNVDSIKGISKYLGRWTLTAKAA